LPNLKIAGATLNQTPLNWTDNLANISEAIANARQEKVDILCLPELCITGYGCEDNFLSNWIYKKASKCLLEIIPKTTGLLVTVGLPFQHNNTNYNTTAVLSDGELLGIYAKQNLALDGVHYEPRWFNPWKSNDTEPTKLGNNNTIIGDLIIEHKGIKIAFEICEDAWRTVGRPAYKHRERGVNLILNPSASHFAMGKTFEREELVVESSKDFECTYLYANLLGNEAGRMIYDGEILIAHHGELIARNNWLSFKNYNLLTAEVDFRQKASGKQAANYKRDKETEFFKAGSLALFDYMRKSRSRGFVLSLSGGADSTTCAVLVASMVRLGLKELGFEIFTQKLGIEVEPQPYLSRIELEKLLVGEILYCAYQATENSSKETLHSAKELAIDLGANFYSWNIDDEVNSYTKKIEKALDRELTWERDDIALQNIQARARSPIIWMMANIKNCLLLTTSNRSEGDVGYTTMDGDTSGSIAPIAAVDKNFIINWLKWAEKELGFKSLRFVNGLAPSAELRPLASTQTDEDDLMPYHILVAIERQAIKEYKSPHEVLKALINDELASKEELKAYITKFYRLWSRNQWKRERIAPSFHLDDFNVDPRTWCRFPILSSGFEEELEALDNL